MAKIDEFKSFVRQNPNLANYIKDGSMTWQKFYELYDMYGSENEIWNSYQKNDIRNDNITKTAASLGSFTLADTLNFIKNIDLDSLQNGISSIQRVVGVVSDLTNKNTVSQNKSEYKPRPLYKHFED